MPGARRFRQYLLLLIGLFVMGFGISLITKSNLGSPPISSIPYVLCLAVPVTFGQFTFIFNLLFLLAEILILGKDFPRYQYLQVFVALFFGIFVDLGMAISASVHPGSYAGQISILLVGCTVLALGIFLQISANVIMNPGEGVVKAIAKRTGVRFGIIKIIFDTSLVCCAALISIFLFGFVEGIREGTIISMLLVGYISMVFSSIFRSFHRMPRPAE